MNNFELLNKYRTLDYLKHEAHYQSKNHDLASYMDYAKAIFITRKSHAKLFLIQGGKVIALSMEVFNDILYTLKDNNLI